MAPCTLHLKSSNLTDKRTIINTHTHTHTYTHTHERARTHAHTHNKKREWEREIERAWQRRKRDSQMVEKQRCKEIKKTDSYGYTDRYTEKRGHREKATYTRWHTQNDCHLIPEVHLIWTTSQSLSQSSYDTWTMKSKMLFPRSLSDNWFYLLLYLLDASHGILVYIVSVCWDEGILYVVAYKRDTGLVSAFSILINL